MSIADMRKEYALNGLRESDLARDPIEQFQAWFSQALAAMLPEANAMVLATVGADGQPSARVVLLKGLDERGFVFYTNYDSRKGRELEGGGRAALVFYWAELERQVRVEGAVERVRPKMMTVVAIMAGLVPILWSTGAGSEVMQRIAVPMIGGMVSSTILTLVVIPAIYAVVKGIGLPASDPEIYGRGVKPPSMSAPLVAAHQVAK